MDFKFPALSAAALAFVLAGVPASADDPQPAPAEKRAKPSLKLSAAIDTTLPTRSLDGTSQTLEASMSAKGATIVHFMNLDALAKRAKLEKDEWFYETPQSTLTWDLERLKGAMQRKSQANDLPLKYLIVAVGDATYEGNLEHVIETYIDEQGLDGATVVVANRTGVKDTLGLEDYPTTLIVCANSLRFCATKERAPESKERGPILNHLLVAVDQVARAQRVTNPNGRGSVLASAPRDDSTAGPRVGTAIDTAWTLATLTGEERQLGKLVGPHTLTVFYFVPIETLTGHTPGQAVPAKPEGAQDPLLHQRLLFLRETMGQAKSIKGKLAINWVVVGVGANEVEAAHAAQIQEYFKVHKVNATPLLDPKAHLSQIMNMPPRSLMILDGETVRFTWILEDDEDVDAAKTTDQANYLVQALTELQAGQSTLTNPYGAKGKERD